MADPSVTKLPSAERTGTSGKNLPIFGTGITWFHNVGLSFSLEACCYYIFSYFYSFKKVVWFFVFFLIFKALLTFISFFRDLFFFWFGLCLFFDTGSLHTHTKLYFFLHCVSYKPRELSRSWHQQRWHLWLWITQNQFSANIFSWKSIAKEW